MIPDKPLRILIVDDEPGIRKLLATAFGRAGYDVTVASDGNVASRICESESFDVLLSDVRMPRMTGHELVQAVATRQPGMRTILMSGFDDLQCQKCGVPQTQCSLLKKPFLPTEAIALVNRVLEGGPMQSDSIS
jgi:two-component system C4-dicarboxylate transport response regulator DctD